jgi:hypothetical protein
MLLKDSEDDDQKPIKIPVFSDGTEWDSVVFELEVNLEKIWKYKSKMNVVEYLQGETQTCDPKYILMADKLIYYALVTAAKRESFARKQIMASRHIDANPRVERNEGLKLFNLFQSIFSHKSTSQANLPNAQAKFYQMNMNKTESAKNYIARVDEAVSDLAILNEKVSTNSWLFIMAKGLRAEFRKCKDGVLFAEKGFNTIPKLKEMIMKEETILGIGKPEKQKEPTTEMAQAVFDGNCNFCNKKGHKKVDCFKFKKQQKEGAEKKPGETYWCDYCYKEGHTTDFCFQNPANANKGKGGKGKGKFKGKGKSGRGKGKGGKGKSKGGRANGNYPASYIPETAHYADSTTSSSSWNEWTDLQEEGSSSSEWQDYNFFTFETEENELINKFEPETENGFVLILFETELPEKFEIPWTPNNVWCEQDFKSCTRGDHPTSAAAKGGPECEFLFPIIDLQPKNAEICNQLDAKIEELRERNANGEKGLWMYLDSGASRSVIGEKSPIRPHLKNIAETDGSCQIASGANLKYLEKGSITLNNEVTVVKDLKFDLYAAVAAAKRGVSCVLDYSPTGLNRSYLLCKKTGTITPLIERNKGILEVPVHLYVDKNDSGLKVTENELTLTPAEISKFWFCMDRHLFNPTTREKNVSELSLFMFDIINSLGEQQKDLLIHARLAHLPRKAILQLIKNGSKGLPYDGKLKQLCKPCLEASQKAEKHGKVAVRNLNGKIGEHLHSDLAVVNLPDSDGFKYVLTIVDEISDEVIVTLLKDKTAATTLEACKKSHKLITARSKSKLKTWQFDRGSEFFNAKFEEWIVLELGAQQLFSNVEHPWENGRAERSFQTIFQKARAMMMYADLPKSLWGKAVIHATYLKNRCPSSRVNLLSPLQYRTGQAIDFKKLRVFGCPAQIWVRPTVRDHNKLSVRSESGTFIGMSKIGNGYVFQVNRTNQIVEVDSKDVKFNETFSDFIDRKGKVIKGGRVLDPDLFNIPDIKENLTKASKETSRFATKTSVKVMESEDDSVENSDEISDKSSEKEEDKPKRTFCLDEKRFRPMETHNDKRTMNQPMKKHEKELFGDKMATRPMKTHEKELFGSKRKENELFCDKMANQPMKKQEKELFGDKMATRPMKTHEKELLGSKRRNMIKNLDNSTGFQELIDSRGNSSSRTAEMESSSSRRAENESSTRKSTREIKPRDKLEPNFEPTYKRKQTEPTLFIEEEDDDLTDLNPNENSYDQLLSCLEQKIKTESGKLDNLNEAILQNAMNEIGGPDPKSQKAIDRLPESQRQRYNDATKKEFEGMKKKDVMEFVKITDVPNGAKIYICVVNWVTKYVLGVYQKTKCRICFGGHHYVKTFTDCFAPTVNFCSVLIMLCLAAMFGWHLGSLDYSQAYLNASIDEECFLRAPEFLREFDQNGIELVWKLKKVIYGHPKGSRLWAECLNNKLKELGFKQFMTDQCVYGKWINWDLKALNDKSHFVFVLVHSDDVIIISNKKNVMIKEKEQLLKAFEGVDQGDLKSFCGVEIEISDTQITLSMKYYWKKVMKRFGISNEKADRPIKTKITKSDCPKVTNEKTKRTYLQIIGSIIFGYTHCRLDLAFPVGMFTRVMHSPSENHLKQLIDFLKYLNATMEWGLNFFRDYSMKYGMKFVFFAYCDSSHGDDLDSFRSTGGWFFFLRKGQGCISSKSGQTQDVALSSTEAETIWACSASMQGAFIKQFLEELQIFGEITFELMEDSQPAINAQRKNVSQSRFRHIKIKYHYIRQIISEGWCKLIKISTKDQVADLATKILPKETVEYFSNILLGNTVALDQSLYAYNDWGVVSEPNYA